jgi:hypothetical protein
MDLAVAARQYRCYRLKYYALLKMCRQKDLAINILRSYYYSFEKDDVRLMRATLYNLKLHICLGQEPAERSRLKRELLWQMFCYVERTARIGQKRFGKVLKTTEVLQTKSVFDDCEVAA